MQYKTYLVYAKNGPVNNWTVKTSPINDTYDVFKNGMFVENFTYVSGAIDFVEKKVIKESEKKNPGFHETKNFIRHRLVDPSKFKKGSFRTIKTSKGAVIIGKKKGSTKTSAQAILYKKNPVYPKKDKMFVIPSNVKIYPGHTYTVDIKGYGNDTPIRDIGLSDDKKYYIIEFESRFVRKYPVDQVNFIRKVEKNINNPSKETLNSYFSGYPAYIREHHIKYYLNKILIKYLIAIRKYLIKKDSKSKGDAKILENKIKKYLSKQQFKELVRRGRTIIQVAIKKGKGYIQSKSFLTLLYSLDKSKINSYTSKEDKKGSLKNPGAIRENRAAKLFESFHHYPADRQKNVTIDAGDGNLKIDAMHLGKLPELKYISDKDINDTGSREKYTYVHGLKKHLDMYVDKDKKMIMIPLDNQDITERGLLYKKGKRVQN